MRTTDEGTAVGRANSDEALLVAVRRRATHLATLLVTHPFAQSTRAELEGFLAGHREAEQAAARVLGQPARVLRARIAELAADPAGEACAGAEWRELP
ncbi:hypothetical protein ACXZ65_37950 [Streptomyces aculeolatus]